LAKKRERNRSWEHKILVTTSISLCHGYQAGIIEMDEQRTLAPGEKGKNEAITVAKDATFKERSLGHLPKKTSL